MATTHESSEEFSGHQYESDTPPPLYVLDIGYGRGFKAAMHANALGLQGLPYYYIGIDYHEEVESGHQEDFQRGLRNPDLCRGSVFIAADADRAPFADNTFDLVIMKDVLSVYGSRLSHSYYVHGSIGMSIGGIREIHRTLKPGGRFVIIEEYTPVRSSDAVQALTRFGFTIESFAEVEGWIINGSPVTESSPWHDLRRTYLETPTDGQFSPSIRAGSFVLVGNKQI